MAAKYIKRLKIRQLLPPIKKRDPRRKGADDFDLDGDGKNEDDDDEDEDADDDLKSGAFGPPDDHFDFNVLADLLGDTLEEFHVAFGVRKVGLNFDWTLFQFTVVDTANMTRFLAACGALRVVEIACSQINNVRMLPLTRGLVLHQTLVELRLPGNYIGEDGARTIAKFLKR